MNKGQVVKYSHRVRGDWYKDDDRQWIAFPSKHGQPDRNDKCIVREEIGDEEGIFVGFSSIPTGHREWEDSGPRFDISHRVKVAMIAPRTHTNRYFEPISVLAEDIHE